MSADYPWVTKEMAEAMAHADDILSLRSSIAIGGPDISPEAARAALACHREKWGCDYGEAAEVRNG